MGLSDKMAAVYYEEHEQILKFWMRETFNHFYYTSIVIKTVTSQEARGVSNHQ